VAPPPRLLAGEPPAEAPIAAYGAGRDPRDQNCRAPSVFWHFVGGIDSRCYWLILCVRGRITAMGWDLLAPG